MDSAVQFVSKIIVARIPCGFASLAGLKLIAHEYEVDLKSIKCFTDHVLNEFEIEAILLPVKY